MREHPPVELAVARLMLQAKSAKVSTGQLFLQESPPAIQINLRGQKNDALFLRNVSEVLGCQLPLEPNTTSISSKIVVYWLGPDEWLVVADGSDDEMLLRRIEESVAGVHAAVTDVTGNRARFHLSGPHARDVLMKGCTLDLHPKAFGLGQCAQVGLARAAIILRQVDEAPTYDIFPRRSFAEYLWLWLRDSMAEYDEQLASPDYVGPL